MPDKDVRTSYASASSSTGTINSRTAAATLPAPPVGFTTGKDPVGSLSKTEAVAEHLGVDVSTNSRGENDQQVMGPVADRLLRMIVGCRQPERSYPLEKLAQVRAAPAKPARIGVREAKGTWRADAA